jgi:DNA processing protein
VVTDDSDGTLEFISLSLLPAWCGVSAAEQLRCGASAAATLDALLQRHFGDRPAIRQDLRRRASAALVRARATGLAPICWSDASYPLALHAIIDPPPVLWTRGPAAALYAPAVAIVGARAASPYGLSVAGRLAADLAERGLVIVSGLARGVDSAAHRGALDARGRTIAVLGSGVDVIYPREHGDLARDIAALGVLVSELVPGTPPLPQFFPMRNRIISGLSRAVVVIEAGEKSGSLITARLALEQGREVLAVPGNVLSGRSKGAHGLLRDGAKIVESADDILEELGMTPQAGTPAARTQPARDPVLDCLVPGEPMDLDSIADRTGLTPARLLPRLLELEMGGVITRAGGGRFLRC